jgi:hypothetical protein
VALCDALEKARNELRVASTALSSASSAKDAAARDTWLLKVSKFKHKKKPVRVLSIKITDSGDACETGSGSGGTPWRTRSMLAVTRNPLLCSHGFGGMLSQCIDSDVGQVLQGGSGAARRSREA